MDFSKIKEAFIGGDLTCTTVDGQSVPRRYFDSAASNLALKPAQLITQNFLNYYSNTHSTVHLTARISNDVVSWAQKRIKAFVKADSSYSAICLGSGVTAPINRLALGLSKLRPQKKTVLVSIMEHHSNDLPHRSHGNKVIHLPVTNDKGAYIGLQIPAIEKLLIEQNGKVNYIAITGASNVTGNITPIYQIAELAHKYDAYIVVDGAQLIAHAPVQLVQDKPSQSIDFFIFSGHKIYAPGTPGVLVGRNDLLEKMEPAFFGGGMVNSVSVHGFDVATTLVDKEQAGTPNIPGIVTIGATLDFLDRIGMELICKKEMELTQYLIDNIAKIPSISLYPKNNKGAKIGVVSFNLANFPHQLLAMILNDYFGIAVRNGCFCAHPFVRECLVEELWEIENEAEVKLYQGMVRASLGLYSTKEDIDALISALNTIVANPDFYRFNYIKTKQDVFEHQTVPVNTKADFNIELQLRENFSTYLRLGLKNQLV